MKLFELVKRLWHSFLTSNEFMLISCEDGPIDNALLIFEDDSRYLRLVLDRKHLSYSLGASGAKLDWGATGGRWFVMGGLRKYLQIEQAVTPVENYDALDLEDKLRDILRYLEAYYDQVAPFLCDDDLLDRRVAEYRTYWNNRAFGS